MPFPKPIFGQVIRYAYLWKAEAARGLEEGLKERPCAIILSTQTEDGEHTVIVLPLTHTPPTDSSLAVEIPHLVKKRLQLDDDRSWVVLTEANKFIWPGPDVRPLRPGDPNSVIFGELPAALSLEIKNKFIAAYKAGKAKLVGRTT